MTRHRNLAPRRRARYIALVLLLVLAPGTARADDPIGALLGTLLSLATQVAVQAGFEWAIRSQVGDIQAIEDTISKAEQDIAPLRERARIARDNGRLAREAVAKVSGSGDAVLIERNRRDLIQLELEWLDAADLYNQRLKQLNAMWAEHWRLRRELALSLVGGQFALVLEGAAACADLPESECRDLAVKDAERAGVDRQREALRVALGVQTESADGKKLQNLPATATLRSIQEFQMFPDGAAQARAEVEVALHGDEALVDTLLTPPTVIPPMPLPHEDEYLRQSPSVWSDFRARRLDLIPWHAPSLKFEVRETGGEKVTEEITVFGYGVGLTMVNLNNTAVAFHLFIGSGGGTERESKDAPKGEPREIDSNAEHRGAQVSIAKEVPVLKTLRFFIGGATGRSQYNYSLDDPYDDSESTKRFTENAAYIAVRSGFAWQFADAWSTWIYGNVFALTSIWGDRSKSTTTLKLGEEELGHADVGIAVSRNF